MFLYHTFIGDTKERAHFSVRDGKRQKETLGYDMERFLPEKLPNRGDTWVWSSSKYLTSENVKKKKERRRRKQAVTSQEFISPENTLDAEPKIDPEVA